MHREIPVDRRRAYITHKVYMCACVFFLILRVSFCFLQVFRCRRRVKSHIDLRSIRQIDRNETTHHIFNIIICILIHEAVAASSRPSRLSPYMRPSRRSVYTYNILVAHVYNIYTYTYYYYYTYYNVLCDDPRWWPTALSRSVSWRGGAEVPDLHDNARGLCIYARRRLNRMYTTAVYVGTYM